MGNLNQYLDTNDWKSLNKGVLKKEIPINKPKDGGLVRLSADISAVQDVSGTVNKVILYGVDISQRNKVITETHGAMSTVLDRIGILFRRLIVFQIRRIY